MAQQIDVNDLVNGLLEQIGQLSKENAMLKVQVSLLDAAAGTQEVEDAVDGAE